MTTKGRGSGEGTIHQRASDGRWVGTLSLGYRDGKRLRKSVYGATQKEVQKKLNEVKRQQGDGVDVVPDKQTLRQFMDAWLVSRVNIRPNTHSTYKVAIERHIGPAIGSVKLTTLRPEHVDRMVSVLLSRGLKASTVGNVLRILRVALNRAVARRVIPINPASLAEAPVAPQRKPTILNDRQALALIGAATGTRMEAMLAVAVGLGLRKGEVLGLRWQDICLDTGSVQVRVQSQRHVGQGTVIDLPLKNDGSERDLWLPEPLPRILVAHRDRQRQQKRLAGVDWREHGLVFCGLKGKPLPRSCVDEEFKALLGKAGLPDMPFHDLRHSCASLLLAQGVPTKTVMDILGHTNLPMTFHYSHSTADVKRQAAEAMGRALGG